MGGPQPARHRCHDCHPDSAGAGDARQNSSGPNASHRHLLALPRASVDTALSDPFLRRNFMIQPIVEIRHLTHSYGPRVAVNDLSLTVQPGEIFGFLGPNG